MKKMARTWLFGLCCVVVGDDYHDPAIFRDYFRSHCILMEGNKGTFVTAGHRSSRMRMPLTKSCPIYYFELL